MNLEVKEKIKLLLIGGLTFSLVACGNEIKTVEVVLTATPTPTVTPEATPVVENKDEPIEIFYKDSDRTYDTLISLLKAHIMFFGNYDEKLLQEDVLIEIASKFYEDGIYIFPSECECTEEELGILEEFFATLGDSNLSQSDKDAFANDIQDATKINPKKISAAAKGKQKK